MGKVLKQKQTRQSVAEDLCKWRRIFAVNKGEHIAALIEKLEATYKSMCDADMKFFMLTHGGSDWWQTAMLQYPIVEVDGRYVVISKAKDWLTEVQWDYGHKYEAMEKVQQLVRWLDEARDRGFGCRDKDFERIAPLKSLMTQQLN